jgi:hypothetical protein
MRIFRFLTFSLSHSLTFLLHHSADAAGVTKDRGASHSFELRVMSYGF